MENEQTRLYNLKHVEISTVRDISSNDKALSKVFLQRQVWIY